MMALTEKDMAKFVDLKINENAWQDHLWFSIVVFGKCGLTKEHYYRIGYAESADGIKWDRKDNTNISVSKSGFDSKMMEYASVIKYKNKYIMFYNGNNYGFDGIGLAVSKWLKQL